MNTQLLRRTSLILGLLAVILPLMTHMFELQVGGIAGGMASALLVSGSMRVASGSGGIHVSYQYDTLMLLSSVLLAAATITKAPWYVSGVLLVVALYMLWLQVTYLAKRGAVRFALAGVYTFVAFTVFSGTFLFMSVYTTDLATNTAPVRDPLATLFDASILYGLACLLSCWWATVDVLGVKRYFT